MAVIYFLTIFHLKLNQVVIPVSPLVVSSHAIRPPHESHHAPRGISVVEYTLNLGGQNRPFPHPLVISEIYARAFEIIVVPQKSGKELLLELGEETFCRVGNKISRIVGDY